MRILFFSLCLIFLSDEVRSLSCLRCEDKPCEVPTCCESGQYVKDVCGCCPVCARAAGTRCGGAWGTSGTCSKDFSCLRSCECKTLPAFSGAEEHKCIFPFKYQETSYSGCTSNHSENGNRWCAYEVDDNGVAVDDKWGDCNDACPFDGEEAQSSICDETSLFNLDGVCVASDVEKTLDASTVGYAFKFEPGASSFEAAPLCKSQTDATKCRCATSLSGEPVGQKAGCNQQDNPDGSKSYGWCFLENIENPSDVTKNCYSDALWSASHGRFWSSSACQPDIDGPAAPEPTTGSS